MLPVKKREANSKSKKKKKKKINVENLEL